MPEPQRVVTGLPVRDTVHALLRRAIYARGNAFLVTDLRHCMCERCRPRR